MSAEDSPTAEPSLPTFDKLEATPPQDLDATAIARNWISCFALLIDNRDTCKLVDDFLYAQPWWRDAFALTWDIRTFQGRAKIATFLNDRLAETGFGNIEFAKAVYQPVFPDLAWILVHFSFETKVATGRGVARLVYEKDGMWRAVTVSTLLEGLQGHPEQSSASRDMRTNQGKWAEERKKSIEFVDKDPEVLIIGGGQSGLEVAARLKHFGVSHVVVERNDRLGDNWRKRYDSLSLHDPICERSLSFSVHKCRNANVWDEGANHMPYLP